MPTLIASGSPDHPATTVTLIPPFVDFVEFVAIEIKIGSMGGCSQTSEHVSLMS